MDAYTGQIQAFSFNYAPYQWGFCDGSLIPIRQNTALFALIGNIFGGDGKTTFAVPRLNGSAICGTGAGPGLTTRALGEVFGSSTVTLIDSEMPAHTHTANAVTLPRGQVATNVPGTGAAITTSSVTMYSNGQPDTMMSPASTSLQGSNAAHNNMQPFLAMNYSICLVGSFPYFD